MKRIKVFYTIEQNNNKWTVWKNAESTYSCGSYGLFSGSLRQCKLWSGKNKIRIKGGKNNIIAKLPNYFELSRKRTK